MTTQKVAAVVLFLSAFGVSFASSANTLNLGGCWASADVNAINVQGQHLQCYGGVQFKAKQTEELLAFGIPEYFCDDVWSPVSSGGPYAIRGNELWSAWDFQAGTITSTQVNVVLEDPFGSPLGATRDEYTWSAIAGTNNLSFTHVHSLNGAVASTATAVLEPSTGCPAYP